MLYIRACRHLNHIILAVSNGTFKARRRHHLRESTPRSRRQEQLLTRLGGAQAPAKTLCCARGSPSAPQRLQPSIHRAYWGCQNLSQSAQPSRRKVQHHLRMTWLLHILKLSKNIISLISSYFCPLSQIIKIHPLMMIIKCFIRVTFQ